MQIKRFTDAGLNEFANFLDQLKGDTTLSVPEMLISETQYSEDLGVDVNLELKSFRSRYEVAEYLVTLFSDLSAVNIEMDVKLWAWCSLFYFDILCPKNASGTRKLRERSAYIPEPGNYQRYYRHLLLGPYLIYRAHKDNPARAMALLCLPPHKISDVEAQIAAGLIITIPSVVELATKLYYNPKAKKLKKGAQDKGAGTPRRLRAFLNQLDLTWDLYATSTETLVKMLPKEFVKFAKSDA